MNISLPNSSYEYVTQEISPYNIEPYLDEIDKSLIWFQTECNINIHGRFRTYNKKIKNMYRQLGCFSDEMYECIQSLNEMTPLLRITNHLNDYDDPEFIRTVKTSLKGRPFRDEDRKEDHARNHLFELDVASKLIESGKN